MAASWILTCLGNLPCPSHGGTSEHARRGAALMNPMKNEPFVRKSPHHTPVDTTCAAWERSYTACALSRLKLEKFEKIQRFCEHSCAAMNYCTPKHPPTHEPFGVASHFAGSHALVFALLFCVARPLSSNQGGGGGKGTVTWGRFPWGCEETVMRSRLLDNRGGGCRWILDYDEG